MEKHRLIKVILSLLAIVFLLVGCRETTSVKERMLAEEPFERTEFLMGTVVKVTIYNQDQQAALDAAFNRLEELAGLITVDEEEENSEVEKINEQAGTKPVQVSDDLYYLLQAAFDYSESTVGSFDMTIGPITELWHIGFDDARKPEQSEIDETLALVDYSKVQFDDDAQTVYLPKEKMRLDLGAIAKGFITDEVVEVLKEHEVDTAIVDLGGNIYVLGDSTRGEGVGWNVGIQDPFETRGTILGSLALSSRSIVTSGIYERFLEVDGTNYHHLMNPETGYPFDNELAGVSVITKKSIDGDGLSTSLFSKGLEEGLEYVNTLEDVDAIFVTKDKNVYISDGLKGSFRLTNDDFTLK
ncbi:FAD:protein FMN transferase [Carnobacterium pleistocenium]|uniref:FAD:protein FMN transferase n=1 Tax=Carnobacterium pleistocenium TaxID=181073 RepID=UPI0005504D15|nr:FAD:protein FMN transferase [Carnobacterium pleistocenium]